MADNKNGKKQSIAERELEVRNKIMAAFLTAPDNETYLKKSQNAVRTERLEHDIQKRIKELRCLYAISSITQSQNIPGEKALQEIADSIPPGMQYPEITCTRIVVYEDEYKTENYRDTEWKISSDIKEKEISIGYIEVGYLENRLANGGSPFLDEERRLISTIAELTGIHFERRHSQEMFENLATSSPVGVYIVQDHRFRYVNLQFSKFCGYSEDELLSMNSSELVFPEDRETARNNAIQMLKGERLIPYEFRVHNKDGSMRWVMERISSIQYNGRRASLGNHLDITELKQAEEELTLRAQLLNNASDAISLLDFDGNIVYANEMFCRSHGYNREELIGMNIRQLDIQLYGKRLEWIEKELEGKGVAVFETTHNRKDGSKMDVEVHSRTIHSGGKEFNLSVERDITERKQAEEALRESEAFRSSLLNNSPNPINVINPDTSIRYVNPALEKLTGYSAEELIGKKAPFPFWRKESLEQATPKLIEDMHHGIKEYEVEFQKKNGEKFRVAITNAPVKTNGNLNYLLSSWVDITERKQTEETLAEEATRRRILIEGSRDGIVVLNHNGNVYESNQRFADMLGYSPEEVSQLRVFDWEYQFPHEQVLDMIQSVDETGDHFETKHRRKDGTVYDVEISTNAAVFAGQKLIFCVCRDITERKQAEERIRLAAEEWRTTFDSVSYAIAIIDNDFNFVRTNKAFNNTFGKKPEELTGKKCYEVIHKLNKPADYCPHLIVTKSKGIHTTEQYDSKSGRYFELTASPIFNESGEVIACVQTLKDITERKKMDAQLIVTDRLAAIGKLSSSIAHEINNPLTGIIGFSDLLLEKEIPDDIKEDLKIINREAKRTADIVKNLLIFARKNPEEISPIDINEIIDDVLAIRSYEQRVNNIEVHKNLDTNLPEVLVNGFELQQVFINLIINAEQFMKEANGRGNLTITTERAGDRVRASFADDGPGIKKEDIKHLFDPFFTTKEIGEGTGLGLSICHGIITKHNGRIYAESEPGEGATFTIELPVAGIEETEAIK